MGADQKRRIIGRSGKHDVSSLPKLVIGPDDCIIGVRNGDASIPAWN
jgi:hypothetical protein